ncbi:MAG: beta-hydroxyacyl-ACP dehydratase [Planctomycetota bacterium]
MRWFWIDRFVEFVRDTKARTIKNITFGEEPIDNYLPSCPHYPHSLMIEGMAQTGGLLVSQAEGFTRKTVLAKVSKASFHRVVVPGDCIELEAIVQAKHASGAVIEGKITCEGQSVAEMELWFAFLDDSFGAEALFPPEDLMRTLRILRLFDVAVDPQGNRISPPQHMLDAEVKSAEALRQAARLSPLVLPSKPH